MTNFKTKSAPKSVRGFGLIEVVIGVSIIFITLIGLVSAYNLFLGAALKNTKKIQAAYLIEEGIEAIRSIRDDGWDENISSLSTSVEHGLNFNGSEWVTSTNFEFIDGVFSRKFSVGDVFRDVNDDISSSGVLDPNTKFFTVSTSWFEGGATTTKSISFYLTKIF